MLVVLVVNLNIETVVGLFCGYFVDYFVDFPNHFSENIS
jgi:F0F1-type ATP synthase assembly protein I